MAFLKSPALIAFTAAVYSEASRVATEPPWGSAPPPPPPPPPPSGRPTVGKPRSPAKTRTQPIHWIEILRTSMVLSPPFSERVEARASAGGTLRPSPGFRGSMTSRPDYGRHASPPVPPEGRP